MYPGGFCSQEEGPVTEYFGWYFPWYNTEHYHSRIGYVTRNSSTKALLQGLSQKEKNYWQSSRNFVKCTGSQIKQPETGSSELKPRFATSSKNHAAIPPTSLPTTSIFWECRSCCSSRSASSSAFFLAVMINAGPNKKWLAVNNHPVAHHQQPKIVGPTMK